MYFSGVRERADFDGRFNLVISSWDPKRSKAACPHRLHLSYTCGEAYTVNVLVSVPNMNT